PARADAADEAIAAEKRVGLEHRGIVGPARVVSTGVIATLLMLFVSFVSPQNGAQAIGPMPIEIATDIAKIDRVEFSVDGKLAGVARAAPWRIAYDFGTTLGPRTIAAKVWSNGYRDSQTATITTAAITAGESLTVDVVEVPLRVRASRTLRANDLSVRENGIEQTIRSIAATRAPAHFAFIVDRSLSMGGGKLTAALNAIDGELAQLRAGDTSSLILFNHNVDKVRPVRPRPDVKPSGGTSLRDAVASIPAKERTYAIVITDGGDRNSELSEEDALRRISTTRTVVHAIVLGDASRFLQRAAANTGGAIRVATRDSIARELHAIMLDINSRYALVYQSHGTKGGWRTIAIAPRRSGITIVNARKGYFAE
ncbi:MAG TPA: Ig-like domain-containing protein, partial [Thermoanaerobaculia bacterium]|nr:Ig-like domain-containing protein [Thermoanaerobaculia bacterium]